MPKAPKKPRCVFCDRPAVCGWEDRDGRLTACCLGHQWIAVAASGSADAEFVRLNHRDGPRPGPRRPSPRAVSAN